MTACLDELLAERFIKGSCEEGESEELRKHVISCDQCRRLVDDTRARLLQLDQPTLSITDVTILTNDAASTGGPAASMIEGYEITETLPQGGQAVVYKAIHQATRTTVAIKVLLPTLLGSARARYYFEREAELIASLDHPNIVRIRDSGIIHQQYFFVMEYIEGEPLNRYVKVNELSFRERIVLFRKVCSAVGYAHQQGIIHRDLKFGNILVDKRGEPHILDFGVAKVIGMSEQAMEKGVATLTGQIAGSLSTMSPEQAAGKPGEIDVRTDVYSLGVMLYNLLTGQHPYDITGGTIEVLRNIQEADPVRPRQIDRRFDPDMEAILLAALSKSKDERYGAAADFLLDLDNWLEGRPVRVRSISTMYLLRKIVARHRYTTAVVLLLLAILLTFGYVSLYMAVSANKARKDKDLIAKQWELEAGKVPVLYRGLAFMSFLEAYRAGYIDEAVKAGRSLGRGSKEFKAAAFLLNYEPTDKQRATFRQQLSSDEQWFAEFIIGEQYYSEGNTAEAAKCYEASLQAIKELESRRILVERWLKVSVEARIHELSDRNQPQEPSAMEKN